MSKKIRVKIEFTIDEDSYEDEAQGANFKEYKKKFLDNFSDNAEDVKIDLQEI